MEPSLFHGNLVKSERILYTPSVFATANLIHLQEIGMLIAQKPHTSRREHLASYLVFLVEKGDGVLEYEGISHILHAGDCVFIDCKKPYSHRTAENLWSLRWAHFHGPNMEQIYEKYLERGGTPCFSAKKPEVVTGILTDLLSIAGSGSHIRDMQICEKLTSLLTLLMEETGWPEPDGQEMSHRRDLKDVKEYLDSKYMEKISLDDLSERFFINKFYLTRLFKARFGLSVNQYLLQVRITHAKQLLRFSTLSMDEIARACGMGEGNYFARMFKKIERMTPGEYRKSW